MKEVLPAASDFPDALGEADDGEALIVDLDGYEGPLHVLLALARSQKVDLLKLSVTRLAEQYLAFVRDAHRRRFDLAADYLVMAAWLTYLKSRLLLPKDEQAREDEPAPEAMAAALALRLARLDAVRRAARALSSGAILGRDVFARGDPKALQVVSTHRLQGDLHGLISAYIGQRRRQTRRLYRPTPPDAYPLDDARARLWGLLEDLDRWTPLTGVAPMQAETGPSRASYLASTLAAGLELVREGALEARQLSAFAEIYLRARKATA
ncbi:MAG TPA: ScpA family protein [Caulobacteraceae bacterium]